MRRIAAFAALIGAVVVLPPGAGAQTGGEASCAQKLDAQLRRFSEQCVKDLVSFTASLPKGEARIASEKDKFYVRLLRTENELGGETVSKQNFPYLKPETETALKALGWMPPDVEFGGFKRTFTDADVRSGTAAQDVVKTLEAFGLKAGDATSVSVSEMPK